VAGCSHSLRLGLLFFFRGSYLYFDPIKDELGFLGEKDGLVNSDVSVIQFRPIMLHILPRQVMDCH
jgi:hypothetical protein